VACTVSATAQVTSKLMPFSRFLSYGRVRFATDSRRKQDSFHLIGVLGEAVAWWRFRTVMTEERLILTCRITVP